MHVIHNDACPQVYALLLEEHEISTSTHVVIEGLTFTGGGEHFALRYIIM